MNERVKPRAVTSPDLHPIRFKTRQLFDLQLASIVRFVRTPLAQFSGSILDVGAGESPWRSWLGPGSTYVGLDVLEADKFGMSRSVPDVVYYAGETMPFADETFDNVLCIEVLEHAPDPRLLLQEIARVMAKQGVLLLTVPWSARRHHTPFDFHRFTPESLESLLKQTGFEVLTLQSRGNDVATIANKLLVLNFGLFGDRNWRTFLLSFVMGLVCLPFTFIFLLIGNVSIRINRGGSDDPLGFGLLARRIEAE